MPAARLARHARVLVALVALSLLGVALVASLTEDRAMADPADVDGVADVRRVAWADDPDSTYLRIVLEDGLSEQEVRDAVDDVKTGYDDEDAPDPGSLQVVFDEFSAGVFPRHVSTEHPDPDLERALWLREDGRATWFGPGDQFRPGDRLSRSGTSPLVIAPAADVVDLALDLDAAFPATDEVRRSFAIGSQDGAMRVQFSNYPAVLDRSGLEAFQALQERYPGTTGWLDGGEGAAVHLSDADVTLPQALARGRDLLDGLLVTEVGWGPLRARTFPELGRMARDLGPALARLRAMPGVRAVSSEGVQVDDVTTLDAVRRLLPDETVLLVREPNDLIGFPPDPVLEVGSWTEPELLALWREAVAIDGLRQINPSLVVETDITDADLARLFALVKPRLGPDDTLPLYAGEAPIYRVSDLTYVGDLVGDGSLAPPGDPVSPQAADLGERFAGPWADAPAG